jgi:hypothetical protein
MLIHLLGPTPSLLLGRVTFIPKVDNPTSPRDYRPITVTSVYVRVLHKILAGRWTRAEGAVEPRQFGSRPIDGCLGAAGLVSSYLRTAATAARPVAVGFLDVSKAFDSVSIDSILRVAVAAGAPPFFLDHLRSVYSDAKVLLPDGRAVSVNRGVRQGDPLSPLLFSAVIREATSVLGPGAPTFGGVEVDHVAYADDLVVLASSPDDLSHRLARLKTALSEAGLTLNTNKSRVWVTRRHGHSGSIFVDQRPLRVGEAEVPALGPEDSLRYLGVTFGWRGPRVVNHRKLFADAFDNLARAPLRPQQRLWVIRHCVGARFLHQLVLGSVHINTLQAIDRLTRRATRQALHLPKDTPVPFFHTQVAKGGLGIQALTVQIPLLKQRRFATLAGSQDPALRAAGAEVAEAPCQRRHFEAPKIGEVQVSSKTEAQERWAAQLYTSVDGRGLKEVCPLSTAWVAAPPLSTPPGLFCRAVALRAGVLPCSARASRGRTTTEEAVLCRGSCGRRETLQHLLQQCAITHGPRVKRHDHIVKSITSKGTAHGFVAMREPVIPAAGTVTKPDLILVDSNSHTAYVLDVAISADGGMARAAEEKTRKYGQRSNAQAILNYVRSRHPDIISSTVVPVVFSWRGCVLPSTARALKALGFSRGFLRRLSWDVTTGSLKSYSQYYRSTYL